MVGEGIDFGMVNIDSLLARADIKNGKFEVTKFDAKSKDGELHVDYSMTLDKELNNSVVAGCLRFKGSEALEDREPKTFAALQTTGAELRSDGLFHIRLTDRLGMMKRLNQECGPNVKRTNGENFGGGPTPPPHLTVMPDGEEARGPADPDAGRSSPPPPPPAAAADRAADEHGAPARPRRRGAARAPHRGAGRRASTSRRRHRSPARRDRAVAQHRRRPSRPTAAPGRLR